MSVVHPSRRGSDVPLAELVRLLGSSLVMYVSDAGIWSYPGEEELKLALADLVGDQRNVHDRAAAVLDSRNVPVPGRDFPIRFTATHDVDLRFLLSRILEELKLQAKTLDRIIESSVDDPETLELAREARGTTLGHCDVLLQIASKARGVSPA
jgi:hypothetical protein